MPEEKEDYEKYCNRSHQVKDEVDDVVTDNVVTIPCGHKADLIIECVGCHEQWTIHPSVGISAEGGSILEKKRNIGQLSYIDVFLDMMKIVVVPIGCERV